MTDAHCHVSCGDPAVRELIVGRDFFGTHPWETLEDGIMNYELRIMNYEAKSSSIHNSPGTVPNLSNLRQALLEHPNAGVGEIGLDRLKCREIPPLMRELFESQLALAFELNRPVVLHGAKCWGQVVRTIMNYELRIMNYGDKSPSIHNSSFIIHNSPPSPTFLFHGFSRSEGLIPDIVRLNGFISVGPAVLNGHAVNYREMVKKIPLDRLLVETDRTADGGQLHIRDVIAKTADVLGIPFAELERITDKNADAFMKPQSATAKGDQHG